MINHMEANMAQAAFNMATFQYALVNAMQGDELEERGAKYRSWDAAQIIFDSNLPILCSFEDRKLNVRYAVEEFLWYCRGDRFDNTIEQHATAWKKLSQPDGGFFSNYGHYIFAKMGPDGISMFQFAAEQLLRNPNTRRAAIPLLETKHCFHSNVDMVCTFGIQFFIRRGYLNMIVNMRSNDALWGLTNDAFCFSMIHRMMFVALRDGFFDKGEEQATCGVSYPELRLGAYTHAANTLHVYERHYEMAQKIIDAPLSRVPLIDVPMFTGQQLEVLLGRSCTELQSWTSSFLKS
jgi:thymidylate synthase